MRRRVGFMAVLAASLIGALLPASVSAGQRPVYEIDYDQVNEVVAAGEAELYPRLGRTMEWDTAAGHAVLLGAGGAVVRFDDHTPLVYGKPGFENPFFIAHVPGVTLMQG